MTTVEIQGDGTYTIRPDASDARTIARAELMHGMNVTEELVQNWVNHMAAQQAKTGADAMQDKFSRLSAARQDAIQSELDSA